MTDPSALDFSAPDLSAPGPAVPLRPTRRSLPIALMRAREAVMAPLRECLAHSGVNEQKWRVLRVLQESGPMELTPLAEEACLLLPSLTRMVRPMESEGLVTRKAALADRRRVVLAITPAGEAVLRTHLPRTEAVFAKIEAEFGHDRLDTLLDLLEGLRGLRIGKGGRE